MTSTKRIGVFSIFTLGMGAVLSFAPALAHAQPAAAPPLPPPATVSAPPPTPPPEPVAVAPAPPVPPPDGALPPPMGGTTPPQNAVLPDNTTNTNAMPATREEKLPPISVGAWVRAGARFQGKNPKKLNGDQMDTVYGELHAGGKIHKKVSVTLNLNAGSGTKNQEPGLAGTTLIEDAIIGFDFEDPIHLWVGQLLVPVDRANYGGPFFMIPWNYPGFLSAGGTTVVSAPAEGPNGRNAGAVVWGDVGDGLFKYAVGYFHGGPLSANPTPLFSGRLSLAVLGGEKGYFGNETYFGDKNLISIAVGGQAKKKGSVAAAGAPTDNYYEVNADALAELKYGDGGWVTGEVNYNHFSGKYNSVKDAAYFLGAVATPKVGPGNIQPMLRYQVASGDDPTAWTLDAAVTYLLMGPALRILANYQHADLGHNRIGNMVQLGAQAIFF
jgi:hypothetical protein